MSVAGARLVRVGPRGVRVTVAVLVSVAEGVSVIVAGSVDVIVRVSVNTSLGVLMGDAVAVKKSCANACRVWIFSTLNVGVGELTTLGKSSGWVSGILPPLTRIGIPRLIAVITMIATNSRLPFTFIPESFPC